MIQLIWTLFILIGILIAAFTGNLENVCNGMIESAKDAIDLLIMMLGVISMWSGFLSIAEGSHLTTRLSKKMQPCIHFLFPKIPHNHPATEYICANFIANLLGLGWACTPIGLKAMDCLAQIEQERKTPSGIASNEMCTFLIINISSIQLIPINMIAYRSQYGSTSPMSIVGPSLLATMLTTLLAIIFCKYCSRKDYLW